MEYGEENSEVDTDDETDMLEGEWAANLLLDHIGGGNGLIKRDTVVHEDTAVTEGRGSLGPQAQNTSSVSQKSSTRRVSFVDERTPIVNKDSDSESDSSTESIRIEFRHTPVDSSPQQSIKSDKYPIQTPADIYKYIKELMSKEVVPKSILKNKSADLAGSSDIGPQRMQWLSQPDSIPIITQETEEPLWNTAIQQPLEEMEGHPVVTTYI